MPTKALILLEGRPDLVGDGAPLGACCLRRLLAKGRCDEGGDGPAAALAGMRQNVSHEVDPRAVEEPIVGATNKPIPKTFPCLKGCRAELVASWLYTNSKIDRKALASRFKLTAAAVR